MERSSHCIWTSRNFSRAAELTLMTAAGVMLMVFATACPPPAPPLPPSPQSLPADARDACPLSPATFASWFQTGTVAKDGVVNPADSLQVLSPNCGFYQWSEQMYMWLTSPAPATYGGGGGRIFDSPAFFDVSPPQPDGSRTFLPHTPGLIRAFGLRAAKVGADRLPVILDRSGRLLEIERPKLGARPMVRDASGRVVEIAHARLEKDGRPVLLDKAGKVIQTRPAESVKPSAQNRAIRTPIVREFLIDRIPIFIDPSLDVIDVEQGQAGGNGVLQAQNGSLVYYATMVNDVFAYFATGTKNGGITPTPTQFPTTQTDLTKITTFATAHGKTFPDPNALAIEVKSSWVEAAGLPNLSSYITMTATIPTYNQSNPIQWIPDGQKTVQLALVGIHVVGSTAGHPEMVWATFEHFANSPRATYSYTNTSNQTITVSQNTAATWLFSANNSSGPFNVLHMHFVPPNIESVSANPPNPPPPFTISPSDTLRVKPWGMDGTNAGSNSEIISMNNHVIGMIASGDVRNNYVMTGATWTIGGAAPNGGNEVGTNKLSNTTMETYQQGSNCFSCHTNNTTGVSHVFPFLKPLF